MAPLRIETLADLEQFEAVAQEWDRLVCALHRPTPFLLHGWLRAWLRHYADTPAIHIARRGDRLVAALPLALRRRVGLRQARFVGGDVIFGDMLAAPDEQPETLKALLAHARRRHDFASLLTVCEDSSLFRTSPGAWHMVERVAAASLDLTRDFDTIYRERTSSRTRRVRNRRRRLLGQLGALEFHIARTADELDVALDDAFRLHALRWKGRFDRSGLQEKADRETHREAVGALAEAGIPRIVTLRLDGRAIAFQYSYVLCNRLFTCRTAYDPDYAAYSPGLLTLLAAIEHATAEGVTRVEFLRGDEAYKLELADRLEPLYQAVGLAGSELGSLQVQALTLHLRARRQLKRSPRLRRLYLERLGPVARHARRLTAGVSGVGRP